MALSSAEQVRLAVADHLRYADYSFTANGASYRYPLQHGNDYYVSGGEAYITGALTNFAAATFQSGHVTFPNTNVSAGSAVRLSYYYAVFSPDDIEYFLGNAGTITDAAVSAAQVLMFDSLKLAAWGAADGMRYDQTKAQDQIRAIYDRLRQRQVEEAHSVAGSNIFNWTV